MLLGKRHEGAVIINVCVNERFILIVRTPPRDRYRFGAFRLKQVGGARFPRSALMRIAIPFRSSFFFVVDRYRFGAFGLKQVGGPDFSEVR